MKHPINKYNGQPLWCGENYDQYEFKRFAMETLGWGEEFFELKDSPKGGKMYVHDETTMAEMIWECGWAAGYDFIGGNHE